MNIRSKKDSNKIIKDLGLNVVKYKVFNVDDNVKREVTDYMIENGDLNKEWNIRDNDNYSGKFISNVKTQEVFGLDFSNTSSIKVSESMKKYDTENLVAQGDVWVDKGYNVRATISNKPGHTLREATSVVGLFDTVEYNFVLEKCPVKHRDVVNSIVDLICEHELLGCIVEFTLYNTKVGVSNEEIVVWEIRSR